MTAVSSFQDNAGLQLLAAGMRAMARIIIRALWLALRTVQQGAMVLCSLWRPIALAACIVGAVVVCAVCPALPVGLAIVAGYGWATMPRVKAAIA